MDPLQLYNSCFTRKVFEKFDSFINWKKLFQRNKIICISLIEILFKWIVTRKDVQEALFTRFRNDFKMFDHLAFLIICTIPNMLTNNVRFKENFNRNKKLALEMLSLILAAKTE